MLNVTVAKLGEVTPAALNHVVADQDLTSTRARPQAAPEQSQELVTSVQSRNRNLAILDSWDSQAKQAMDMYMKVVSRHQARRTQ